MIRAPAWSPRRHREGAGAVGRISPSLNEPAEGVTPVVREYTWGLDLSGQGGNPSPSGIHGAGGVGGLLATQQHGGGSTLRHYIYFYDANGNVGQLINASGSGMGNVNAKYEYYPFGGLLVATGSAASSNPFRFSTKYRDNETGCYYYGYRYLRTKHGRWLNRDPISEMGGLNLYAFVQSSPVNLIDLLGLEFINTFKRTITYQSKDGEREKASLEVEIDWDKIRTPITEECWDHCVRTLKEELTLAVNRHKENNPSNIVEVDPAVLSQLHKKFELNCARYCCDDERDGKDDLGDCLTKSERTRAEEYAKAWGEFRDCALGEGGPSALDSIKDLRRRVPRTLEGYRPRMHFTPVDVLKLAKEVFVCHEKLENKRAAADKDAKNRELECRNKHQPKS